LSFLPAIRKAPRALRAARMIPADSCPRSRVPHPRVVPSGGVRPHARDTRIARGFPEGDGARSRGLRKERGRRTEIRGQERCKIELIPFPACAGTGFMTRNLKQRHGQTGLSVCEEVNDDLVVSSCGRNLAPAPALYPSEDGSVYLNERELSVGQPETAVRRQKSEGPLAAEAASLIEEETAGARGLS
jgi:hypothetical protein